MLTTFGVAVDAAETGRIADTLYTGGSIITIDDNSPRAEAVAVKDGRIVSVGRLEHVNAWRGDETETFDLKGRTMLPGFVDSHGHVVFGGLQAMSANLLPPPDGTVKDIASLQAELKQWLMDNAEIVNEIQLIIGFGYDNAQLAELRHPTRADLDAVSTDIPIMIIHQSGHLGVANSRALAMAGIDASSKNPAGGVIQRDANGEPNGVLEEYAFFPVLTKNLARIGEEGLFDFARAGTRLWASFGYTTAQDGRSSGEIGNVLQYLADNEGLPVDVVAYPDVLEARDYIEDSQSNEYKNGFRVGGCKLTIDGSPQGFTALRDRPYYKPVGDYPPNYAGYAAITKEQVQSAIDWCYQNGFQVITHANGEGASDMLIVALKKAQSQYKDIDNRPVLIHGQFLREDQVDSYQQLGVFLSLFPMHTFYWGDWHYAHTVGPVAAQNISPTGWLVERDMMFGTHHDAPVALPSSVRVLSATVTRRTRSGRILGENHRVDVMTALKAMTIWPAWQHFEEKDKGSIEVGKRADFVILSDDPTAIDPEKLAEMEVLTTIKDGKIVFEKDTASGQASTMVPVLSSSPHHAHDFLDTLYSGLAIGLQ
ncbi:MAG: amidohydrolase [Pseudomonadota bacterium]